MARKKKTAQTAAAKSKKAPPRRPDAQAELPPAAEVTPAETVAAATAVTEADNPESPAAKAATAETPTTAGPPAAERSCPNCQAAAPQLRSSGYCSEWCEQEAASREPPCPPHDREAPGVAARVAPVPPTGDSSPRARPLTVEAAAPKKLSAIDAAARVLAETGQPMNCQDLIAAMAEKGYWTSPARRTPAATLYASLLKEITTKGAQSRFRKVDRGLFARNA